jgi:hypothetical protein
VGLVGAGGRTGEAAGGGAGMIALGVVLCLALLVIVFDL